MIGLRFKLDSLAFDLLSANLLFAGSFYLFKAVGDRAGMPILCTLTGVELS